MLQAVPGPAPRSRADGRSGGEILRLHFREYGQGAPLVILHGLFGSLDNWTAVARELAGAFRVLAVDQRNHGHSPHAAAMDYPLMAADLVEFVRRHSPGGAHVLGHSMGGKTAMQFALQHPGLVRSLVVVDMAPRAGEPEHHSIFDALQALDLAAYQSRKQVEAALAPRIPELAVRKFLVKSLAHDPAGAWHWRFNLPGLCRNYAWLNAAVTAEPPCDKPALFVRGEKSGYLRDDDLPAIRRLFPRAEFRVVPGAGHWVHADAPGIFLQAVRRFLVEQI